MRESLSGACLIATMLLPVGRAQAGWEISYLEGAPMVRAPASTMSAPISTATGASLATAGSVSSPAPLAEPDGPLNFAFYSFRTSDFADGACESPDFDDAVYGAMEKVQEKFKLSQPNFPVSYQACSWKTDRSLESYTLLEGKESDVRSLAQAPPLKLSTPLLSFPYALTAAKALEMHYFLRGGDNLNPDGSRTPQTNLTDVFVRQASSLEGELNFVTSTCQDLKAALEASPLAEEARKFVAGEPFDATLGVEITATTYNGSKIKLDPVGLWVCAPIDHRRR